MWRIAIGVVVSAGVAMTAPARAAEPQAADANVQLAGGSDIVRILPPEFSPSPAPTPPGPRPPPAPPSPPPERRADPVPPSNPPPAPKQQQAGRYIKIPVRLGSLAADNTKSWFGANYDSMDRAFSISIGLPSPSGALITETTPAGPAAQAGVKPGDVVTSLNGAVIADPGELRQRLLQQPPNAQVTLEVWRYVTDDRDFVATLRKLAEEGNAAVMYRLGAMYSRGSGVPRNETEAARWFRMGANAGNTPSMTELAFMLLDGRGIERNTAEGLRLLKNAADNGNLYAMWRYGGVLLDGKYAPKDLTQAAQIFQRAAEAGYAPAMVDLGLMYANGNGLPRNYTEAARWYEKAIGQNNAAAMVNLGILYQRGNGVEKNDARAVDLYRKAAALNQPAGIHNLAAMLDSGRGAPRDSEQAAELVMRALRMGHEFSYRQMLENAKGYTREFRMGIQRRLRDEGAYTGPLDGEFGQTTQAAITAFFNRRR